MRKFSIAAVSLTFAAVAFSQAAQAETPSMTRPLGGVWDLSPQELKAAYPAAADQPGREGQVVTLRSVTLMGLRWDRIEFRYDENRRLVRLRLVASGRAYDQVEARLSNAMDPLWALGSDDVGQAPARQAMLCDYGDGGAALTFDQPALALPRTITASLDQPTVER